MRKLLLIGNPNIGKSVLFTRLTGLDVVISNYPGSTVEYTKGTVKIGGEAFELVDVPGIYSLEPTNKAEEVAVQMLSAVTGDDVLINVVDAANLERNLSLTLELLRKKIPVVIALNRWDMTASRGIEIDAAKLSAELSAPVIPVVGVSGEGVKELTDALQNVAARRTAPSGEFAGTSEERWRCIGAICEGTQKLSHRHPSFLERLQELSIRMPYALVIALGVLLGSFSFIRFAGETLINSLLDPLFMDVYMPRLVNAAASFSLPSWLSAFLLGVRPVPMESFGLLTTGLYIPLVVILPYIMSFYFVLSFLEDSGYLVRIAIILDRVFHKVGLHGYASIPLMLGLGCKVPAVMSTRILESEKEKLLTLALILLMAPCMPQSAMIYSVLINFGVWIAAGFFFVLAAAGMLAGFALNKFIGGETPELFVEVPPYQMPHAGTLVRKVYLRLKDFLLEAVPMIITGIALVSVLDLAGLIEKISALSRPVVQGFLGFPGEMSIVMISGFLRKDVSIALLVPFDLTLKQLLIASFLLVVYLPCVATFSMIAKEFSFKTALKVSALTFVAALVIAGFLNLVF